MKRIVVCLFMVVSLMLAPMAHAAGLNCPDTDCTLTDQSSDEKQDDGKLAKIAHSCCCQHQVAPGSSSTFIPFSVNSASPVKTSDGVLVSVTLDPLLEPPLHA